MAGVSIEEAGLHALKELGVRDSQKLSADRREALYPEILKLCKSVAFVRISPREIDRVVRAGVRYKRLNYLEAKYFARVIDRMKPSFAVVDAADVVPSRFKAHIQEQMSCGCELDARHFADRDYVVVGAASIVAKVERDAAVTVLREEHGDFGSGYPSDPRTRRFFTEWVKSGRALPDFVRKSWRTWERLGQTTLAP